MIWNRRISVAICLLLCAALVLTSCGKQDTVDETDGPIMDVSENNDSSGMDSADSDSKMIIYEYPTGPVPALKEFLEKDIAERGLPLEVGEIAQVTRDDDYERKEFMIRFTNDSENVCVVSFTTSIIQGFYYLYENSLNGEYNPSFTIAFKDPDRPRDMVAILTSVFLYLNPDLGVEEAERLAIKQDDTISVNGYSIPQDMGGYQVQTHYTNPHVYFKTEEFDSSLCVTVTALKQIWGFDLDYSSSKRLSTGEDFKILTEAHNSWDKDNGNQSVYADFIITDWWQYQEPLHYEIFTWVAVESPDGHQYQFRMDTMKTPYEFGVGQKYTLFIYRNSYGPVITYAIQLAD